MEPTELVLGSGGARGILILGAAAELQRAGIFARLESYRGTSIGAVLAAGLALGRSPRAMLETAIRRPFEPDIAPGGFGVDTGKGLSVWIRRILRLSKPITLRGMYETTGKNLVICVCNVTRGVPEYWSHATHPDTDLLKALRISCSVPLVFAAVTVNRCLYIDGAVVDPVPVSHERNAMVMAFRPDDARDRTIDTMNDFASALCSMCVNAIQNASGSRTATPRYVLDIDPAGVDPLDFAVDGAGMRAAYASGRKQASNWLKKNV